MQFYLAAILSLATSSGIDASELSTKGGEGDDHPAALRGSNNLGHNVGALAIKKPIADLSISERHATIEQLRTKLVEAYSTLDEFEKKNKDNLAAFGFDWILDLLDDHQVDQAVKAISNLIELFDEASQEDTASNEQSVVPLSRNKQRHRRTVAGATNDNSKVKPGFDNHRSNLHSNLKAFKRQVENRLGNLDPSQNQQHILQRANPMTGLEQGHHPHHLIKMTDRRRRLQSAITKEERCLLLAECTAGMTLYDSFVYFHSDDIDPNDNTIDENIITFDEGNLLDKYDLIQERAGSILRTGSTHLCDSLLQEFHRSIEREGGVVEWQGATVSQVCFAENTVVHVKLEDITSTFLRNLPWEDIWEVAEETTERIAGEVFRCSQDIFDKRDDAHQNERFVFGGCGNGSSGCSLNNYKFPYLSDNNFKDNLDYGDRIYLQVNSLDYRWLTGGRTDGNDQVRTKNIFSEIQNSQYYEWFVLSDWGTGSRDYQDERDGDCVKYGQSIFLQSNTVDHRWLTGTRDNNQNSVRTGNVRGESSTAARVSYRWLVRSEACINLNPDCVHEKRTDECVGVGEKIVLENANNLRRKLSGGRYSNNEEVRSFDIGGQSVEWIVLREHGDGTRIVKDAGVVNDAKRDEHGQLTEKFGEGAYSTNSYSELQARFETCQADREKAWDSQTDEEEKHEDIQQCLSEEFLEPIRHGLELVFGANASPGYVCGTADALKKPDTNLPGRCCLDGPYELDGSNWGTGYDCSATCKRVGPFLSGLSEPACRAHGGTFCQEAADCSVLQACVTNFVNSGSSPAAFKEYVSGSPTIDDPTNFEQCGRARNYFGFDQTFVYDEGICEDIEQLQYTKDFAFIEEFFDNEGGGCGAAGCNNEIGDELTLEAFVLGDIDRTSSTAGPVQNGKAWRAINFALSQAVAIADDFVEVWYALQCPDDITGSAQTICAVLANAIYVPAKVILVALRTSLEISQYTYGEVAEPDNIGPIEVYEATQAVHGHMQYTGDYMHKGFNLVLDKLDSIVPAPCPVEAPPSNNIEAPPVLDPVVECPSSWQESGRSTHKISCTKPWVEGCAEDCAREICDQVGGEWDTTLDYSTNPYTCHFATGHRALPKLETLHDGDLALELKEIKKTIHKLEEGLLDMMVTMVDSKKGPTTTLLVLATFGGARVDNVELEVKGFDEEIGEAYDIRFESKTLKNGAVLLKLNDNKATLVFVHATHEGFESSKLVNLLPSA